jgi:hypothetical protein
VKPKQKIGLVSAIVGILVVASVLAFSAPASPIVEITVPKGGQVFGGGIPTASGIENIYIVDISQVAWNIDFGTDNENVLGVITGSGLSCNIPYDTPFAIVVAVKGHDDNMAYVQVENLSVELAASGSFTITAENSTNANEHVFVDGTPTYIRVNAVWDNATVGYTLSAGGSLSLDPVSLWCWS